MPTPRNLYLRYLPVLAFTHSASIGAFLYCVDISRTPLTYSDMDISSYILRYGDTRLVRSLLLGQQLIARHTCTDVLVHWMEEASVTSENLNTFMFMLEEWKWLENILMKLPNEKAATQQNFTSGVSRKASKSIHGPVLWWWWLQQKYLDLMPGMIWIQCQRGTK